MKNNSDVIENPRQSRGNFYPESSRRTKLKILTISFFILLGFFGLAKISQAATINAASCSQADVQAAINSAATGDIVFVPAGSCTWNTYISIPTNKSITVKGAGKTLTHITGTANIWMAPSMSRVTGFDFTDLSVAFNVDGDGWRIDNNNFTYTTPGRNVSIIVDGGRYTANPTGLIDHNTFTYGAIIVYGNRNTDAWHANASGLWSLPTGLGTGTNAVFIEDNTFTSGDPNNYYIDCMDANYGGRFVFRYNTLYNTHTELHGRQGDGNRGNPRWEIYNNSYTTTLARYNAILARGGTGVAWGNTISGPYSININIDNQSSTRFGDYSCTPATGDYNYTPCDGNNPIDGNRTGMEGYPCRDQIGRGQDVPVWPENWIHSISKANPAVVTYKDTNANSTVLTNGASVKIVEAVGMTELNNRTFIIANLNKTAKTFELSGEDSSGYGVHTDDTGRVMGPYAQALSPLYSWNNTKSGSDVSAPTITKDGQVGTCVPTIGSGVNRHLVHLVENRDFYHSSGVQTSKGVPFDGTLGVGVGLIAYRPDTCDPLPVATGVPNEPGGGVAYWATDTNTLYRCSAKDTWTVHYKPYTYPHPLRVEATDTTPPSPPTGVTVI